MGIGNRHTTDYAVHNRLSDTGRVSPPRFSTSPTLSHKGLNRNTDHLDSLDARSAPCCQPNVVVASLHTYRNYTNSNPRPWLGSLVLLLTMLDIPPTLVDATRIDQITITIKITIVQEY